MMGSTHTYDIKRATGTKGRADTQVEMALNPEEIENMDSETMAIRAEAALREQQSQLAKEDLSDMVAEHAAKQKNKRKRKTLRRRNTKSSSSRHHHIYNTHWLPIR